MANKAILKKSTGGYMAKIPQKEIKESMTELSIGAYKLLMYYYGTSDGWRFHEGKIADTIGTSERQLKKFRKELIEKEYLMIQRGQTDVYFIGKQAVEQFKEELKSDGLEIDEKPIKPVININKQEIEEDKPITGENAFD